MPSEPRVLERHGLPEVPSYPPPWDLRGNAFIIVLRLPPPLHTAAAEQLPATLCGGGLSGVAVLMYVNYTQANCGPYRELLFSPGSVITKDGSTLPTITRIVVSSYESVVNGRANWGIPKDQADFEVRDEGKHTHIAIAHRGRRLARLHVSAHGPALPVRAGILPQRLRTVVQHWDGQEFRIALNGAGQARYAKVRDMVFDGEYFPNLGDAQVVTAIQMNNFHLAFPVAESRPVARVEAQPPAASTP